MPWHLIRSWGSVSLSWVGAPFQMPSAQGLPTPPVSGTTMPVPAPASKPARTHGQPAARMCPGEVAWIQGVYLSVYLSEWVYMQSEGLGMSMYCGVCVFTCTCVGMFCVLGMGMCVNQSEPA